MNGQYMSTGPINPNLRGPLAQHTPSDRHVEIKEDDKPADDRPRRNHNQNRKQKQMWYTPPGGFPTLYINAKQAAAASGMTETQVRSRAYLKHTIPSDGKVFRWE